MKKGRITTYFYKKRMNGIVDVILSHHIGRIKKSYLKKVSIRLLKNEVKRKGSSAFIEWAVDLSTGKMCQQITIQFPELLKVAESYLVNFLEDNIIDILRHEFAHLKYKGETKEHQKWMKEIDLFKKDKKK